MIISKGNKVLKDQDKVIQKILMFSYKMSYSLFTEY